jgi:hypothetical protein
MASAAERWRRLTATETWRGGVGEEVVATERWGVGGVERLRVGGGGCSGGGGEVERWRQQWR